MSDLPAVEIRKLSKNFSGVEVLRDVDLVVQKGEVVSILGSSGSGKSTLLRCINWLETPDSGSVFIAGQRMGYNPEKQRAMTNREMAATRARTGMVFQSFNLWPHLTVAQNVSIAPIKVKGTPKAEARDLALRLLEKVGLGDKAEAYPFTLSGGQKQRVAIARALAMSPEVILFDEPSAMIAPKYSKQIYQFLTLMRDRGKTILLVDQNVRQCVNVSDHLYVLELGRNKIDCPTAAMNGNAEMTDLISGWIAHKVD